MELSLKYASRIFPCGCVRRVLLMLLELLLFCLLAASALSASTPDKNGKIYVAVLFNNTKSNITGGDRYVGVFVQEKGETEWRCMTNTNLFSFGISFFRQGKTERYYVAGGNGVHRSTDGGKTWGILTDWQTMEILSVAPDPVDSTVIYAATPYGIFKSADDGKNWVKKMRGFKRWYTEDIVIDRRDHRTLYAASEDDLYRSTDAGENWSPLKVGAPGIITVLQYPTNAAVILVGTEDHGVRVSFDGGKTWKAGAGLPAAAFYSMSATSDGKAIYAGGYKTGVWRSEDLGATWQQIWTAPEIEAIYSLFVNPTDTNHLMVGTNGKGLFESHDKGKTWKPAGLEGTHVKQIVFYPY